MSKGDESNTASNPGKGVREVPVNRYRKPKYIYRLTNPDNASTVTPISSTGVAGAGAGMGINVPADAVFLPGVGSIKLPNINNGDLLTYINELRTQMAGLSDGVNELSKDNRNKTYPKLSGDLDVSECLA
jgi:hypothetical protein